MSEEYEKAIKLDKELYKLLKDKDLTLDKLEQQIEKANASYKKVLKQSGEFDVQTEKYNKAREDLYDAAGYHIKKELTMISSFLNSIQNLNFYCSTV